MVVMDEGAPVTPFRLEPWYRRNVRDESATATQTVTEPHASAKAGTHAWARLMVVSPPSLRQELPVPKTGIVCGRKPGDDGVPIVHRTVSRRHLQIRREGPAIYSIADAGSRNGTWHNGEPVGALPRVLAHGDVIRFGDVVAVFECGEDGLRESPSVRAQAVVGRSAAVIGLRQAIERAARDTAPVLVEGESGSGKESVAAELHRLSGRNGPLVIANCAALSASLVDSQLFGHERGAFTGAVTSQEGFFRAAGGGTLFLDEFGELPLEVQPKLLRAVEAGEVVPVGQAKAHVVDTRVIAATHRDLEGDIESGRFRRDLFARISLLRVRVPPLRERRADIVAWLNLFVERWRQRQGLPAAQLEITPRAVETMLLAAWPENLRGLDRLAHRCGALAGIEPVRPDVVLEVVGEGARTASAPSSTPSAPSPSPSVAKGPRPPKPSAAALREALESSGWNIRAVARHYARDRRQVYRWMDAYGIERPPE